MFLFQMKNKRKKKSEARVEGERAVHTWLGVVHMSETSSEARCLYLLAIMNAGQSTFWETRWIRDQCRIYSVLVWVHTSVSHHEIKLRIDKLYTWHQPSCLNLLNNSKRGIMCVKSQSELTTAPQAKLQQKHLYRNHFNSFFTPLYFECHWT